jgi:Trk K+ transport system NAD-binding subunit
MNGDKQKVLLFGLGQFGRALLRELAGEWQVTAVDIHEARSAKMKEEVPDAEYFHGAAESIITWKQLDLSGFKYIISAVRSIEVDLEVCRIARDVYKLKIPILALVYNEVDEKLFEPYHAMVINPLDLGIEVILHKMTKHISYAANVGLGRGELIEVAVKARSHLVDRKLKYLSPSSWHISALYRDGRLILPNGNSSIKIGDRVLLVGDPAVLGNLTKILLKGLPQFPLQYGAEIVVPLHEDFESSLDEGIYWKKSFKVKRLTIAPFKNKLPQDFKEKIKNQVEHFKTGVTVERFQQLFPLPKETGVIVIPAGQGWLKDSRLRMGFKRSAKPFLLSRGTFPYEGVVVLLNGPDPGQAMEAGIEIARLLDIPYQAFYVTLPKEMRGQEEDHCLRLRRQIIMDYESIYKASLPYDVKEGNPVRETLKFLEPLKNHLLVVVTKAGASIAWHKPNVPYLVAKKTHLSALVIPESHTHE